MFSLVDATGSVNLPPEYQYLLHGMNDTFLKLLFFCYVLSFNSFTSHTVQWNCLFIHFLTNSYRLKPNEPLTKDSTLMVRVCTVNSFFSRRTKSEKWKTAVFRFPYAVRKSTHGFPYRFSHSCRSRKTKNELCITFSMYIVNTKLERRYAKNEFSWILCFVCHIQHGMRKTKNGPCMNR